MRITDLIKKFIGIPRVERNPTVEITAEEDDYSQLDPEKLKEVYRKNLFVKAIVNISANFVFSSIPKVECDDEEAKEILNNLYQDNIDTFIQVARESSLTGNGFIKVLYTDKGLDIRGVYPSKVSILPSPYDLRDYKEVHIFHQTPLGFDNKIVSLREIHTKDRFTYYINDRIDKELENPIKEIPVLHIAYNRMSNELYGSGDITESVYRNILMYESILNSTLKNFELHARPIPVFFSDNELLLEELKKIDWIKHKGFVLDKEARVELLEPSNLLNGATDLLKMCFYNIVILSETPEFLLGVHMPSSWASTKEQLHPIIRKTKRYQNIWKQQLKKLNRLVLKYLELYEGYKFSTYETKVEFPEVETDKLEKYVKSINELVASGILTIEEGRKAITPFIPNLFEELELEEKEDTNNFEKEKK
ncbi:MAG: hypothetical protein DSY59_04010 [Persephonella sp.]|nr:MAG: hypothetical protein DSY59_04010 [Persephonella sp.]